jgi:FkbM family methyltransferase
MPGYDPGRPANPFLRWASYIQDGILLRRLRLRWSYIDGDLRRARWKSLQRRHQSLDIHLQEGVRMRLFMDSEVSYGIYAKNFERKERVFHNAFLRPGDVYLDVGANIGLFTLIAAHRVGNGGHVFALEPTSSTFQRLLTNIQLNQYTNVTPLRMALSDTAGPVSLHVSEDGYDGRNSLTTPTAGEKYSSETVSALPLDQFVQDQHLDKKITMIKIDVEGWETHVLAGGQAVLSAPDAPILQIEFAEEARASAGSTSDELYHRLTDLGYQLFSVPTDGWALRPVSPIQVKNGHVNVIAAKDPSMISRRLERS